VFVDNFRPVEAPMLRRKNNSPICNYLIRLVIIQKSIWDIFGDGIMLAGKESSITNIFFTDASLRKP
jgi:hypothetical protein